MHSSANFATGAALVWVRAAALALLFLGGTAAAQEDANPPSPPEAAPAKPKRVKPKRPAPTPAAKAPEQTPPADAKAAETTPPGTSPTPAAGPPDPVPPPPPVAASPVICDAGQSVLYDGPKDFSFWVTRSGSITIDNPLRPLTPDVTQVLQLVIDGKVATVYGADLQGLRRGAGPRGLEALIGGPIKWDAKLVTLLDPLEIFDDAGRGLATMRFKECGAAPTGKELPVPRAKADPAPNAPAKGAKKTGKKPPGNGADQAGAPPPPSSNGPPSRALPQGALGN